MEPKDRNIAMVFQTHTLYPHLSVKDNLAFPLRIRRCDKELIEQRVSSTAEMLGISALLSRKPRQLSGGQMQRVAIGKAIVREPKVFLMDEPLSNLDEYAYAIAGYLSRYPNLQSAGNSAYAGLEMIKLAPAIIFGGYLGSWPLYGFGELIEKKI